MTLPFKLLVFVLDKPIVADPLITACLFDLILLLLRNESILDEKLITIANNLFRMLELDLIWSQLAGHLARVNPEECDNTRLTIQAVSFAIMHLSVCDESSLMIHLHLTINIVLNRLFKDFIYFSPSIASEMLELCLLLLAKLPVTEEATLKQQQAALLEIQDLSAALIERKKLSQNISVDAVYQLIATNSQIICKNSQSLLAFKDCGDSEDLSKQIQAFSKASTILTLLLQRLRPDVQLLNYLQYDKWIEALSSAIKYADDDSIISAILNQIADHSQFWSMTGTTGSGTVKVALVDCLLPKLWRFIVHDGWEFSKVAPIIARIIHIFPKESDISFAKIISDALRRQQSESLECFALLWNYCMNAKLLLSIPLRLSLTVMTEALCSSGSTFRSRKCTFTWTCVLCQHLSVLLDPMLTGLADVIECGFNSTLSFGSNPRSNQLPASSISVPKAFKKSFDSDEAVYYLELLHSLLEVDFDGCMNFLQGHEVSPSVLAQWLAFEDSLRSVLQVELGAVERRSYYNFVLVLMVPLLLLDDGDCGVQATALRLMTLLGRSAGRDSSVILNVLIALSIDNLSASVSRDVEQQIVLIGFFLCLFRGNDFIAGLFDREDIVALGELCRKALRGIVDIEVVQAWTDFTLAIAFLPLSDVELIPTVLLDSVVLRLTAGLSSASGPSEALLTSLLACVAKLTVFYFAARALPASSASTLKKSVSGMLSDTVQDVIAAAPFDIRSGSSVMNIGAIESILFSFLEVMHWLKTDHMEGIVDGSGGWSQCLIMLSDTCRQLYMMNPPAFTHLLIALFMKHFDKVKR